GRPGRKVRRDALRADAISPILFHSGGSRPDLEDAVWRAQTRLRPAGGAPITRIVPHNRRCAIAKCDYCAWGPKWLTAALGSRSLEWGEASGRCVGGSARAESTMEFSRPGSKTLCLNGHEWANR